MDTKISQRGLCVARDGTSPATVECILQREVQWRPLKQGSRAPATLVPAEDAPSTQQSDPSTMATVVARNARPQDWRWLHNTPKGYMRTCKTRFRPTNATHPV